MAPDLHLRRRVRPFTVTVLGSAGTFPQPENPCSGYLLQAGPTAVWVDCGSGTFGALQEHVALADVDAIVVSHEHPDHCLELPLVRNAAKYVLGIDHVPVYGTAGTRRVIEGIVGEAVDPPLAWTTITDGTEVVIGDLAFRFARTDHPVETLAMRVEAGGRVLAYSADTGPGFSFAALDPAGTGFDLALCEATFAADEGPRPDGGPPVHLTAAQAGAMADRSKVGRLALTHLLADVGAERADEAADRAAFDGPVELARPGHTFTV